ncbi:MAG: tetratricopeptide repeat protein [Candidatus Hinthialibacter antarcticus]|nr:tetratricopeptide repeat protein [Candidatus Hinthialibacter antarcticus]
MNEYKRRHFNDFPTRLVTRFWLPAALFLFVFAAARITPPDLAFYYAYGHSMLYDIDFYFAPQFAAFPFANHELYLSAHGLPANDWPMGAGVLWAPFMLFASILRIGLNLFGFSIEPGGYAWFDQWVITFSASWLFGAGTLYASYRLARSHKISHANAVWACALMAAGSSLTYHLYVNSADSHPPSAFFIVLSLLAWQSYKQTPRLAFALFAGAALGIAGLVRPHNLLWGLTPLLDWAINPGDQKRVTVRPAHIAVFILATLAAFLPQLMAWKALYGSWFALPRSGDVLWLHPHLYEMLFSDFHGMISWSPLFGLGIAGLLTQRRALPYLLPMLLTIYIYSCNIAWWAGGSFGNRRMVSCAPIFILGLAWLLQATPKAWFKGFAILCAVWTWLLLVAEMGGAIQLDHYQSWREILAVIPQGVPPGLSAHFTRIDWGEHALLRFIGAVSVCAAMLVLLWLHCRFATIKRTAYVFTAGLLLLCAWSGAALLRTPNAINPNELTDYIPRDRFTWVVYFEKGFYEMQTRQYTDGLESMLAAAITEPSHPQPWMYIGANLEFHQMHELAYLYFKQAMSYGSRTSTFFTFYLNSINRQLRTAPTALLYNERGVVLTLMKQYDQAVADFERALKMDPDYNPAIENLDTVNKRAAGQSAPMRWE